MIIFEFLLMTAALVGLVSGIADGIAKGRRDAVPEPEIESENERGRGYLLDGYKLPERDEGAGVYGVLLAVFRSLQSQRAAGFRAWIPACIEKMQMGEDVPTDVALLALERTREELAGGRFSLASLDDAILKLKEGEGD